MSGNRKEDDDLRRFKERSGPLLLLSGAWVLPLMGLCFWLFPGSQFDRSIVSIVAVLVAPLPALVYSHRQRGRLLARAAKSEEDAAQQALTPQVVDENLPRATFRDEQAIVLVDGQHSIGDMSELFGVPVDTLTVMVQELVDHDLIRMHHQSNRLRAGAQD